MVDESSRQLESNNFHSLLGEGSSFTGNIEIDGVLRVYGDFRGDINCNSSVLIGHTGRIACNHIRGEKVVIGGICKGDIYASEQVKILSSGIVLGDIYTSSVIVEEGALFHGRFNVSENSTLQNEKAQRISASLYQGVEWDLEENSELT